MSNKLLSGKEIAKGIKLAISFMSIYRFGEEAKRSDLKAAIPYFPLVGFFLGLVLYASARILNIFDISANFSALILTFILLVQTRFLHIDGLADVFDAGFGGYTLERRREILKDTHVGVFAVVGVAFAILAYYLLISTVVREGALAMLIAFPAIARFAVISAGQFGEAASDTGLGAATLRKLKNEEYFIVGIQFIALFAVVSFSYVLGGALFSSIFMALLFAIALPHAISKAFDGINGDVLGASIVLAEIFALFTMVQVF